MSFYKELVSIESQLVDMGYTVGIPGSARAMKESGDFDASHFKGGHTNEERDRLIRENFDAIKDSDAILVINNAKNGVDAYIGANVLMEIALAYYFKKKIYLWNQYPVDSPYKEELDIFNVQIIEKDLEKINV